MNTLTSKKYLSLSEEQLAKVHELYSRKELSSEEIDSLTVDALIVWKCRSLLDLKECYMRIGLYGKVMSSRICEGLRAKARQPETRLLFGDLMRCEVLPKRIGAAYKKAARGLPPQDVLLWSWMAFRRIEGVAADVNHAVNTATLAVSELAIRKRLVSRPEHVIVADIKMLVEKKMDAKRALDYADRMDRKKSELNRLALSAAKYTSQVSSVEQSDRFCQYYPCAIKHALWLIISEGKIAQAQRAVDSWSVDFRKLRLTLVKRADRVARRAILKFIGFA